MSDKKDEHKPYISPAMLSIAADEAKEAERKKEEQEKQRSASLHKQPYQPLSFVMSGSSSPKRSNTPKPQPDIRMVDGTGRKNADKPFAMPQTDTATSHQTGSATNTKQQSKKSANKKKKSKKSIQKKQQKAVSNQNTTTPQKAKKKRYKKNYTLHYLIFGVFAAILLMVLSYTVLFRVDKITVVSSDKAFKLSKEQIAQYTELTGVHMGDNLLRMDTQAAEQAILASGTEIDAVKVSRKFPTEVVVSLTPSHIQYVLYSDKTYYCISENNRVVEAGTSKKLAKNRLLLSGFTVENCEVGSYYNEIEVLTNRLAAAEEAFANAKPGSDDAAKLEQEKMQAERELRRYELFLQLVDKLKEYKIKPVTSVKMHQSSDILFTVDKRITVELGGYTDIDYKLSLAQKIIFEELEPDAKGTLNLTVPGLPGFQENN